MRLCGTLDDIRMMLGMEAASNLSFIASATRKFHSSTESMY
jgi:hypothetical protein